MQIIKYQPAMTILIPLILVLTLAAGGSGLLDRNGSGPFSFTTVHGETVQMSGQGVYFHDTLFTASLSWGTDLATLFVGLPVLLVSAWLYRRGSLRGGLLLTGTLAYFLYYGASLGLGIAYNRLFLVYIALFSACFYAFALILTSYDLAALSRQASDHLPRRGMAVFMFIVGIGLALIWLSDAVAALLGNLVPTVLGPYTTVVTYTLDVGIIAVACILAGVQLWRRAPFGIVLFATLSIMLILVGAMVVGQTLMQLSAGIHLTPGELIGKDVSFMIMAGIAIWLTAVLFRDLDKKSLQTILKGKDL